MEVNDVCTLLSFVKRKGVKINIHHKLCLLLQIAKGFEVQTNIYRIRQCWPWCLLLFAHDLNLKILNILIFLRNTLQCTTATHQWETLTNNNTKWDLPHSGRHVRSLLDHPQWHLPTARIYWLDSALSYSININKIYFIIHLKYTFWQETTT
jgi:hypothetical protein